MTDPDDGEIVYKCKTRD